jgi:hypothetical protein
VDIDVVLALSYFVVDQDAGYRMSITRRESLWLFGSGLGAAAVPLYVRSHDSLAGQKVLDRARLDPRIRAAVSSCGFGSLRTLKRDRINHNYALFVPGLADNGDYGAVLALVAPRPFLVVARTDDPIFPKDGIEETLTAARRVYVAKGASDLLTTFFEPGTHAFSPTMRATAYAWLDQWLVPAK